MMPPPERFRRRVFPHWDAPVDGWQSVAHHEAGHVVVAECYGLTPHSASINLHGGNGQMLLRPLAVDSPPYDEERGALGMFGLVGLADASCMFEEIALRSAVILVAGQQAELVQACIEPGGVLRTNTQDARQASYLLQLVLGTDISLGWAQLQARYLLKEHWARVEEIANVLKVRGVYAV